MSIEKKVRGTVTKFDSVTILIKKLFMKHVILINSIFLHSWLSDSEKLKAITTNRCIKNDGYNDKSLVLINSTQINKLAGRRYVMEQYVLVLLDWHYTSLGDIKR